VTERDLAGVRVGILTASDKGSRGEREDVGGPTIRAALEERGAQVAAYRVLPDEREQLAAALRELADDLRLDAVFTTGGTGLSPRDVTPQATLAVIDYAVPGLAEAMRATGREKTPFAALSRQVVGVRGTTLIVNLPGSPKAVREGLAIVLPVLAHAVQTLRDALGDHARQ
jgi:molybdopterin adenylyltransferase